MCMFPWGCNVPLSVKCSTFPSHNGQPRVAHLVIKLTRPPSVCPISARDEYTVQYKWFECLNLNSQDPTHQAKSLETSSFGKGCVLGCQKPNNHHPPPILHRYHQYASRPMTNTCPSSARVLQTHHMYCTLPPGLSGHI